MSSEARHLDRRVGGDVTTPTPHRPGRAELRHPVLRAGGSLTTAYVSAIDDLLVVTVRNATPHRHRTSAAIHCRFVDRFVRSSALSRVSRQWLSLRDASLPSAGSCQAQFPDVLSTVKALRLPVPASPPAYWFRSRGPRQPPPSCLAEALPYGRRRRAGQDPWYAGGPTCRQPVAWTVTGSPRFPDDPSRAFAQLQDPGRTDATSPERRRRCCPRVEDREGSSNQSYFGACHWASAPAVHASRAPLRGPGRTRFRPAGSPLPRGSRTRWIATKGFRSHDLPPFQDLPWRYLDTLGMKKLTMKRSMPGAAGVTRDLWPVAWP